MLRNSTVCPHCGRILRYWFFAPMWCKGCGWDFVTNVFRKIRDNGKCVCGHSAAMHSLSNGGCRKRDCYCDGFISKGTNLFE